MKLNLIQIVGLWIDRIRKKIWPSPIDDKEKD
jgi:hypothetical protein